MKTRADLFAHFDAHGIAHHTLDHPPVFRVGEGEGIKDEIPGAHTKNLFLKDAKGRVWLISAQDRTAIDLKRLHTVIGSARLSFGSPELMAEVLGVTPGSVTAFALVNDVARRVTFVLDRRLAEAERVNFHPLENTATTGVSAADFRKFLTSLGIAPMVVDFDAMAVVEGAEAVEARIRRDHFSRGPRLGGRLQESDGDPMTLIGETQTPAAGAAPADLIKDGTDQSFAADVLEASREVPVVVDFWATWCGPCRQLGPALEKAVLAARGKVKLVKVDIDKNPQFAGQLRVQSIPAVFAFVDGRPVDGFMGALPDSQVKQFIDRLASQAPANAVDELLTMAKESLEVGDVGGAAQAYAQVLQAEPDNVKALGGLAKVYLAGGDAERAAEIAAMAPADAKDPDLESVRATLALAEEAPEETGEFDARLAKDPDDHEARFEVAKAQAGHGRWQEAVDNLLTIIEKDRTWNEDAARKQLLTIFDAAGAGSDITRQGRRRLSSILFS